MNPLTWIHTLARRGTVVVLAALVTGGCQSSTEPSLPPLTLRPTPQPEADLLDPNVPRSEKTVLEALWELQKAVAERDRRIAELEARLARAQKEDQDTPPEPE